MGSQAKLATSSSGSSKAGPARVDFSAVKVRHCQMGAATARRLSQRLFISLAAIYDFTIEIWD
eukprot:7332482-Pyramimonas_sp.AAC.1